MSVEGGAEARASLRELEELRERIGELELFEEARRILADEDEGLQELARVLAGMGAQMTWRVTVTLGDVIFAATGPADQDGES